VSEKYLGQDLIFIISLPRSGSTLLQRVLAGHPDIGASSEPWILLHQAYGRSQQGIFTDYGTDWSSLGVNEFISHYTDGDEVYDDAVRAFAKTIYSNAMHKAGVRRFIDKTPRYVMIMPDLLRWFPRAKFIFLIRNPLSVLASIINTQIDHDLTTLERFGPELLSGPQAILSGIRHLGEQAIVVSYEKFVAQPEVELASVCDKVGIEFQAEMLNYTQSSELKGHMQDRTGVKQYSRPVQGRTDGWKDILSDPQQLEFARGFLADMGADLVNQLGYDFDELNDTVRAASERNRPHGHIYPWNVAILTPERKKGRDQMHVILYRNIRDHGPFLGRLKSWVHFMRRLIKTLQFTFGRAKSRPEEVAELENAQSDSEKKPIFR
jgi:hypothetical protein